MEVKPKAELIDYTDNPERNVATAARLCYSKKGAAQLNKEMSREKVEDLVRKVVGMGHTSTLEHTYFFFHVQCSRVTSHQIVRQRIGTSYSQRSQRYVTEDNFDYIVPPKIKKNEKAYNMFKEKMGELEDTYLQLIEMGIPKEDARFILPTIKTNIVISYNARSLMHFIKLRSCNRAQWEIRSLARQMLNEVKEVAPVIFENAGPPCETDQECPEGDLSCGKIDKIKEKQQ
ncbi:MAG: FAD-dependent thymidylate synthase [Halanaerobiales bacterium]|nr:FAD-dependent thymidylate synthase [Halanaerobiales bacterium]